MNTCFPNSCRTERIIPLLLFFSMMITLVCPTAAMPPRPSGVDEFGQPVPAGEDYLPGKGDLNVDGFLGLYPGKNPPASGTINIPVLMIDFPDRPGQVTPAQVDSILFRPSVGSNVSMRDYYTEVSRSQLLVTGQSFGWYRAPMAYQSYVAGQGGMGNSYPLNLQGLVQRAVQSADAAVDFRAYDSDGPDGIPNSGDDDGMVDCLILVFAGYASESSNPPARRNTLGSCMLWMDWGSGPGPVMTADGVSIDVFCACSELRGTTGNRIRDIGVYCHEFGHALGLPDLYSTIVPPFNATYPNWNAAGHYCLMGFGAWGANAQNPDQPVHMTGFCKALMGWANPVHVTVDLLGWSIPDVETTGTIFCSFPFWPGGPTDVWLPPGTVPPSWNVFPPPVEGFIVENRQPIGFDSQLPGGLLIYHYDGLVGYGDYINIGFVNWWQNVVEWDMTRPLLDVECADQTGPDHTIGCDDLAAMNNIGDATDYFLNSVTGFDLLTLPSSISYSGAPSGFAVRNIGASQATMTADIIVGNAPGPGNDIWVKDCTADTGVPISAPLCDHFGYRMQYSSPDIWVDNNGDGLVDQPVAGGANKLFIKVRNRGTQGIDIGTVEVYDHSGVMAPPPTGPPTDLGNPFYGMAHVCSTTVQSLAVGDSAIISTTWVVPSTPPPPNWNFPPTLGLVVRTATDTLNGTADVSMDNNLAICTGKQMWIKAGQPPLKLGPDSGMSSIAGAKALQSSRSAVKGDPEPTVLTVPLNNPFETVEDILFNVELDLPPTCTAEINLPERGMVGVPVPFVITMDPLETTPLEVVITPGPTTSHGETGEVAVHEYLPGTFPDEPLGGMVLPFGVDLFEPMPVTGVSVELVGDGGDVPGVRGALVSFEPVLYDVSGLEEPTVFYGIWRDTVLGGPVDLDDVFTFIAVDAIEPNDTWEYLDIDYPCAGDMKEYYYTLVAFDPAGNHSEPSEPATPNGYFDYDDHDMGSVRLTVTTQGSIGYMEAPGRGSGFQYPKDSTSLMWTGGLWVGHSDGRVANRDYINDPVQDWERSEVPDGSVARPGHVDWMPGLVDHEGIVTTAFRDTGAEIPMGLYVEQTSVDFALAPDDDYVLLNYRITNDSAELLTGLQVGYFADFDLGDPFQNEGATDPGRNLIYAHEAGVKGTYAGVSLLPPTGSMNMSFIDNTVYVHPQDTLTDPERSAFLGGVDPAHQLTATTAPGEWSVMISAAPFDLAPGQSRDICFVMLAGDDLVDLQANTDAAHARYYNLVSGVEDEPVIPSVDLPLLGRNVPNPFNPRTEIFFRMPNDGWARMRVHDLRGRIVATLLDGQLPAGQKSVIWDAKDIPSGVYFYRFETAGKSETRKMTLLK